MLNILLTQLSTICTTLFNLRIRLIVKKAAYAAFFIACELRIHRSGMFVEHSGYDPVEYDMYYSV